MFYILNLNITIEMAQTSEPYTVQNTTVIDTDVHLSVEYGEMADYLDDEDYRRSVKEAASTDATHGNSPFPSAGTDFYNMGSDIDSLIPQFSSPEAVYAYMDKLGVDTPILNVFFGLGRMYKSDMAIDMMSAYNDVLVEQYLDELDDCYGLLNLAPQDPEKAAAEIDRLGDEKQIVGCYIGSTSASPPMGDPSYDVMYRAAEDKGLTMAFHGAVGDSMIAFPNQYQQFEKLTTAHTLGHMWTQSMTVASIVANGVPVKFPDLNFHIMESGISWIPFVMWRMNEEYGHRPNECALLEKNPENYIRDAFSFSTQPLGEPNDPDQLRHIIEMVGPENLMYGSDYPHWDFNTTERLDKILRKHFSSDDREQILHRTAEETYNIG